MYGLGTSNFVHGCHKRKQDRRKPPKARRSPGGLLGRLERIYCYSHVFIILFHAEAGGGRWEAPSQVRVSRHCRMQERRCPTFGMHDAMLVECCEGWIVLSGTKYDGSRKRTRLAVNEAYAHA
jgi:hypothetical protein